ncbi:copper resistance system multicopper oxidase [Sphingomonas desiccabilis]|uniref:Copper resistance system multicopper oxidase n=1 Tax=Sphingomonas desiccabilis TaxID=429134 RepID=A0A4Q2IQA0_9SPHN|nr:copper resistance system multicopper oxidase [Sphingomonas desiccabilis]MBB3911411.1 CopA family copper-resistance protein [Sphingomonas desiccabilis]RXZ31813.1 copper resistance system multicopper oxidase [Sphingomonas desiccabilis]
MSLVLDRRRLLRGATLAGGGMALSAWMPAWAQSVSTGTALPELSGEDITLRIQRQEMTIDGRRTKAIGINGTVPAPLLRLREGQKLRLHVHNDLDVDSSLHWHGLLLPAQFDGVPGVSFPGIRPRTHFTYEFPIVQSGTYWYHSHSGFQEQMGLYGPIVIDPAGPDPVAFDREHVIVLSDHSRESPDAIFRHLKVEPGYYNRQRQTLAGLAAGKDQPLRDRLHWGAMRMDPTDIADVTGETYTYLVNGHGPADNWIAQFRPGERVRLRIINASSMTTFNVRIPGLPLTVVEADGQHVRPVTVDELQIAVAETYDVVVTPAEDRAYTLVGESIDRSGMARATLAPHAGMVAPVPPLRRRPVATMKDMGMGDMQHEAVRGVDPTAEQNASARLATPAAAPPAHGAMDHAAAMGHAGMDHAAMGHAGMDHGAMGHSAPAPHKMDHGSMKMRDFANAPQVARDPSVQTIAPMPVDRTGEPGQGLADAGHRVLVYRDLVALAPNPDVRAPSRSIEVHLTGNMERYMWSMDGLRMSDSMEPLPFSLGERVRVKLVNDTMMGHPIHLHGHFFELVTGHGGHAPRKHTVLVHPGGTVTFDFTADAIGDWAFHCHMLYHMASGMMRVVSVRPAGDAA